MEITYLKSNQEFEDFKNNEEILVVDFYSTECPPCEKLAPIYEKAAKIFPNLKFLKILRQDFRSLAESLGVSGSPTVLFFKNGSLLEQRLAGEIQEAELVNILESISGEKALVVENDQKIREYDLCIIGNGPAGMTAAVYAARYKIDQLLVGDLPGGLMTSSHKICNFPSEIEISGMDLSQKMAEQVNALEVPQISGRVELITKENNSFILKLFGGEIIKTKTLLIATGTKHRHLNLPKEDSFVGRGLSYCATCDAMFYRNKTVAVIGGGDSANTASLYLGEVAEKVYQIYRGDSLRGETAWIDQIKANPKINVLYSTQVLELLGDDRLSGIKIDREFEGSNELLIDGIFVEIGSEPDLSLINQLSLDTDRGHYIITQEDQGTSCLGVFAAGDITTGSDSFRQIITACSEGAIAAQSIFKYLQVNKK
jgi:thioredoxin reductase (NADPH)